MDFTLKTYRHLLNTLLEKGYEFALYKDFCPEQKHQKIAVLRHDVDKAPLHSLKTAEIEHELGIAGTYYFRIVKQSFNRNIIKSIAALGHEIGYHYEDLALAKGDVNKAIQLFEKHLNSFADLYKIETIVMHGSPASRYDNRLLWEHYTYHKFGIRKEPYFDIDFSRVLYLTDTGRRWNGRSVSVRDKELTGPKPALSSSYNFRTTDDIINALKKGALPDHIMFNFHPQRWTDNLFVWSKELIMQNIKNPIKKMLIKKETHSYNDLNTAKQLDKKYV
jgi:hypothetical protein